MLSFKKTKTTVAGKPDEARETNVKMARLSKIIDTNEIQLPDLFKIDIEGAEENVLRNVKTIFAQKKLCFLYQHMVSRFTLTV
ncbi:MAG: FkbM family methyltransferase [Ferruginibacter sp.]|nr:FkbM family methyltransferase [Ferruginibacter sp.]